MLIIIVKKFLKLSYSSLFVCEKINKLYTHNSFHYQVYTFYYSVLFMQVLRRFFYNKKQPGWVGTQCNPAVLTSIFNHSHMKNTKEWHNLTYVPLRGSSKVVKFFGETSSQEYLGGARCQNWHCVVLQTPP